MVLISQQPSTHSCTMSLSDTLKSNSKRVCSIYFRFPVIDHLPGVEMGRSVRPNLSLSTSFFKSKYHRGHSLCSISAKITDQEANYFFSAILCLVVFCLFHESPLSFASISMRDGTLLLLYQ